MAVMDERVVVIYLCVVLIACNIGFLFHNFYPASIYMGDTGALFLGYCIAVISMMGLFKNLTLFSFIIPIIILAVPIIDTLFTIVRRYINGKAILMADNKHIHYQLLRIGFSHRATVLFMYGVAATFGVLAIVFSNASLALKLIISFIILLMIHFFAEVAGVIGTGKHPILSLLKKMADKNKRVYEK